MMKMTSAVFRTSETAKMVRNPAASGSARAWKSANEAWGERKRPLMRPTEATVATPSPAAARYPNELFWLLSWRSTSAFGWTTHTWGRGGERGVEALRSEWG